jgi:hypothetical protein
MTMTLDNSQQRFGPGMNLDYQQHNHSPAFSNPWTSSSSPQPSAPNGSMFVANQHQQPPPLSQSMMAGKPPTSRPSNAASSAIGSYGSMPVPSPATDMMNMNRVPPPTSAAYAESAYTSSASPVAGQFTTSGAHYDPMGYAPAPVRPAQFGMVGEADRAGKFPPTYV